MLFVVAVFYTTSDSFYEVNSTFNLKLLSLKRRKGKKSRQSRERLRLSTQIELVIGCSMLRLF